MSDFSRLATVSHELHGYYANDVAGNPRPQKDKIQIVSSGEDENWLVCDRLTLWTPQDPDRILLRDLTMIAPRQGGLMITGASGVGKTTLLRAVAGLWHAGEGRVTRVTSPGEVLFLPQRPYMQLGSLRDQLLYPHGQAMAESHPERYTKQELLAALAAVGLGHVASEARGGLERTRRWTEELSLGEQQRIGIARVWLHRPRFAILDEATSANDLAHEANMYRLVALRCEAYLSVGHRATIEAFHGKRLRLLGEEHGGQWRVEELPAGVPVEGSPP